jgi:hypothetical protein
MHYFFQMKSPYHMNCTDILYFLHTFHAFTLTSQSFPSNIKSLYTDCIQFKIKHSILLQITNCEILTSKGKDVPVLNKVPCHKHVSCTWLSTTPWKCMGSGGIAPHILNLGTTWRWVASFTLQLLYPQRKSPQYPLDRRLGWSGMWWPREKIHAPARNQTAVVHQVV